MAVFEFGNFRLDVDGCTLLQDGRPVELTPKAFDLLVALVENHGRLLTKEALMERLWPGTFVEEANLANNISLLRKALGDTNAIQTVPRRGYRFAADVRTDPGVGQASSLPPVRGQESPRHTKLAAALLVAILLAAAAGLLIGRATVHHDPPTYTQITFRRGVVTGARLEPDGETVVFSASYDGRPAEIFTARVDQRTSRPLGVSAHLVAVSRHGELAVLTKPRMTFLYPRGMLSIVPLTGGAPREIADNVEDADWLPDGKSLAILRWAGSVERVEWPMNRLVYSARGPAWVSHLRISPDGERLAILLHESERFDDRGRVVVFDRAGHLVTSSRLYASANGIAWTPDGGEIWVSASPDGLNNALFAVDRRGHDRVLTRAPVRLVLFDTASNGTTIAATEDGRSGVVVKRPGETAERDLSWLDGSWVRDMSADGRTILFDEEQTGGGTTGHVYTRTTDGASAIDLGEGNAVALSPDGKWVLARQRFTKPPRLVRIPTGAGQPAVVRTGRIETTERATWLADNRHIVFIGNEPGRPPRTFLLDAFDGSIRPVTPEGTPGFVPTPDGAFVLGRNSSGAMLYPIAGGSPRPVSGIQPQDQLPHFTDDARALLVSNPAASRIDRIDLTTGARTPLTTYGSARPASCLYTTPATLAANGTAYTYTYVTTTSDLFAVTNLR